MRSAAAQPEARSPGPVTEDSTASCARVAPGVTSAKALARGVATSSVRTSSRRRSCSSAVPSAQDHLETRARDGRRRSRSALRCAS